MKRARRQSMPGRRNPVARSPLLAKGGPHGKSERAKRREANAALRRLARDPKTVDES